MSTLSSPLSLLTTPLAWLGRRGTPAIAGGVFIGLLAPPLASLARPLLVPAILLPFVVALLRLDWPMMRARMRRPGLLLVVLAWQLIGSAVLVAIVAPRLPLDPTIAAAAVTTAACAPLLASGALALLMGLDVGLTILVTVTATALVPFTLPPIAHLLAGLEIDLDPLALSLRLAALIGGSFALSAVLRRVAGEETLDRHRDVLSGLAVFGLILFAVAIMDGVTGYLLAAPRYVVACLLVVFALNVGLQAVTAVLFLPLGLRLALTVGLVAGNNNMGIVIAAMADRAPFDLTVYVAMGQFPIYLLPALQRPFYRRLMGDERGV
jgi:BASS family bile acid:Na+ symporter